MSYILGIDTGGTYTDGVLLNFEDKAVVAKAKAFTTPQDLTLGIEECLNNLGKIAPEKVGMVALSTTLATNAIVEGRGGKVGLILIGKRKPAGVLPAQKCSLVPGGHDLYGIPFADLDTQELRKVIAQMRGEVDTLAISGNLSNRNPDHENQAREIVQKEWDVPVVCAHELSSKLGYYERTVTACLNARLLPIIRELLLAVKAVLKKHCLEAPVMVVKGDGSLISEEKAFARPVETILSGPAASVVGATFLTGLETVMTLDMGGTTTDIGIVQNKRWRMNEKGAVVAGWRTHVNTAEITTFGIGGDSYIRVEGESYIRGSQKEKLHIGPLRVRPLSVVSMRYPNLVEELKAIQGKHAVYQGQDVDCWLMLKHPQNPESLRPEEQAIVRALEDGAHNVLALERRIKDYLSPLALRSLEQAQIIGRAAFTPTDVLHCLGLLQTWNRAASLEGARILAQHYGCGSESFAARCLEQITRSLGLTVLQSIALKQGYSLTAAADPNFNFLMGPVLKPKQADHDFSVRVGLNYPIAAIGAPVAAYLPDVGGLLHSEIIIPEHSEVANAVGAAVGKVSERVTAIIKPGFKVHAPWGYETYMELEDARNSILTKGRERVLENARQAGVFNPEVVVNHDVFSCETDFGTVFVSEALEIVASGYILSGDH
ncbi:hydantoinase/oxoprolinase family protein [Desulfosporosinus sp. PR]|uniref:hydantoinase/oxoprolinase family protein n=1 Tax=Candidatus Desulfosporosinus nitrosoreducens TaxID=3401928 RepID=UPI0027F28C50|nr:hydantoinase/oxoprolinase family protein [Desulfosporosinus sp. PR]MDQ7093684.1 hydantoinase/oxoprolinase family protein [Desulfosporosinus sp. PR]